MYHQFVGCVANQVKQWYISGCPVLAQSKYQIHHGIVGKHVHLLLLKKHGIPTGNKWSCHVPNVVTETDDGKVTIYRDKPIKNDKKVSYNRPDVKVIDKEEKTWCHVGLRFQWIMEEKINKYIDFAAEVRRQFMVKTVIVFSMSFFYLPYTLW